VVESIFTHAAAPSSDVLGLQTTWVYDNDSGQWKNIPNTLQVAAAGPTDFFKQNVSSVADELAILVQQVGITAAIGQVPILSNAGLVPAPPPSVSSIPVVGSALAAPSFLLNKAAIGGIPAQINTEVKKVADAQVPGGLDNFSLFGLTGLPAVLVLMELTKRRR